jgi:MFS transporter, UMF1 family
MDKKQRIGWYFYDWANSAFSTTVVTVFLGPYLTEIAKSAADANGYIFPLGISVKAGSFFPYLISLSVLLQIVFLPYFASLADFTNLKKHFMIVFAYLGAIATMFMFFITGGNYLLGGLLFLFANLAFGASVVFYNSILPSISTEENRETTSSIGWAFGYLGGGILLALNLFLFSKAADFGVTKGYAVRLSLASAGIWWALFTLLPLVLIKKADTKKELPENTKILSAGFKQLKGTLKGIKKYPQTLLFLIAFLLYSDGVQTVISLSSQFGSESLGLSISTLTAVILMVQFVAFFGALLFGYLANRFNEKRTIIASLIIWIAALVYAYVFLQTGRDFFILAAVIGLVLGGTQALSRSVYSKIIPKDKEAEYFSLYELGEKGTSWLGPLVYGLAIQFTGNYRLALFSLIIFFIVGMIVLSRVNLQKAKSDSLCFEK